jgi:hypothetical protein
MIFEIDFNRDTDYKTLEEIGAKPITMEEYDYYTIEVNTFEELEQLLAHVETIRDEKYYSAVISFDPPTIYLDKDV